MKVSKKMERYCSSFNCFRAKKEYVRYSELSELRVFTFFVVFKTGAVMGVSTARLYCSFVL